MPCWTTSPWPRNLYQTVSGNPGAVHFRVLRAIDHADDVDQLGSSGTGKQIAVIVVTEPSGLDPLEDRLIEVVAQRFRISIYGQIQEVERVRSWLEDPVRPLPERIS